MKAKIVHNRDGKARLLLAFETHEERTLFEPAGSHRLERLVIGRHADEDEDLEDEDARAELAYVTYAIEHEPRCKHHPDLACNEEQGVLYCQEGCGEVTK